MKKVIFWVALGFIALMALLVISCEPSEPEYSYVIVSNGDIPPYYSQEKWNYCGPACILMYACFDNPSGSACLSTQSQIMWDADDQYRWGLLDQDEICRYMNKNVSNKFAVYQSSYASTFYTNTKQLINAGEPFICGLNDNHWVLVVGYRVPGTNYSADPAKICDADSSACYGFFYDMESGVFLNMAGTPVVYVGMNLAPAKKELLPAADSSANPPVNVYANYYDYPVAKKGPDIDDNIPFADGNNGISNPLENRIIRAADSTVAVWGAQQLAGYDPGYASQFQGASAVSVELVTNMAYLRFGDPEDFPCPINCGGQTFWVVTYANASYYVGAVRIKFDSDSTTFEPGGITGFIATGSAIAQSGQPEQPSQANKLVSKTGFITRQELHKMYPECTFFPFWDLNDITGTVFLPFWYVKRPDGSRFILHSSGIEMVRNAQNGVLEVKDRAKTTHPIPEKLSLSQNYPNPFNAETQIYFAVPKFSTVMVELFNVLGQKIKTLVSGEYQVGEYRVVWDGTNQNGEKVSSGIYMYRLQVDSQTESRKMILTK